MNQRSPGLCQYSEIIVVSYNLANKNSCTISLCIACKHSTQNRSCVGWLFAGKFCIEHDPCLRLFATLSPCVFYFSEHEDECFDCGDGGELIMCSKTGCSKCYHLSCLTIDKIPHGDWLCPWHFCDDCGKASMLRCQECSNSFCHAHAPGQITKMADGRYLCDQHPDSSDSSQENTPTRTTSDPVGKSEEPVDMKVPIHPGSASPNAIEESPNPTTAPKDPINTSATAPKDPVNASADPANSLISPTNVLSSPTDVPSSPTACDPSSPTNTSIHSSTVPITLSIDPTNAPEHHTSDPKNPTSEAENAINTPDDSSSTQEDLSKN